MLTVHIMSLPFDIDQFPPYFTLMWSTLLEPFPTLMLIKLQSSGSVGLNTEFYRKFCSIIVDDFMAFTLEVLEESKIRR